MNITINKLFVLLVLVLATPIVNANSLLLVSDGNPNATIVVEKSASDEILQAAHDLQFYVKKISGVELPLKTDGVSTSGVDLNIGKTTTALDSDVPGENFGWESFSVRFRDGSLYLRGKQSLPTAFATYSFIENQLGVKWFAPGDDWTYVPKRTSQGDLEVTFEDYTVDPDFSPRIWSGHNYGEEWKLWNLRNKTLQSDVVSQRNFQNNIYKVFPPSKFGETHPEYYALVNGKRAIPSNDRSVKMTPCLGNLEVQKITVDYIRNYFDKNPDQDSFSLGMDDVSHMCECSLCKAMDSHPDDHDKRRFSNRYYTFVNIIAQEIKKTHPEKFIGTLIYNIVRSLPENVPKLEDNVFGFLTQRNALWYKPEEREADQQMTYAWAKRVKHLSRYDYFGMHTLAPRFYPHLMDEAIKIDKSLGFNGMYGEMYTFLPQTAPMIWSLAKLQWEADLDIDSLLHEFYEKMFGDAAPMVREYFSLMEQSWMENRPGRDGWVWRNLKHQALSISPQDANRGEHLLTQALKQTKNPLEKQRVEIILAGLKYGKFVVDEYDLATQISNAPLNNLKDALHMKRLGINLGKTATARETFWQQAEERDDLLGVNIRGMKNDWSPSFFRDASSIELPTIPHIIRLIDWFQKNNQESTEHIRELVASFPESELRLAIEGWSLQKEKSLKSRIRNGNFADQRQNKSSGEGSDWITEGIPNAWSLWSRFNAGSVKYAPGRKEGNAISLRSAAPGDSLTGSLAQLLQNSPGKPGEKYLAIAWVKLRKEEDAEKVFLRIRTRRGSGGQGDVGMGSQIASTQTTEWQPLIAAVTIPERATFMTVVLSVREGEATFDDVALYKLP